MSELDSSSKSQRLLKQLLINHKERTEHKVLQFNSLRSLSSLRLITPYFFTWVVFSLALFFQLLQIFRQKLRHFLEFRNIVGINLH